MYFLKFRQPDIRRHRQDKFDLLDKIFRQSDIRRHRLNKFALVDTIFRQPDIRRLQKRKKLKRITKLKLSQIFSLN